MQVCTCLGLLFTTFPVRSACLCAIAITAFALWKHIVVACTLLGQQTITATLCIICFVRLVPSVLTTINSALAARAYRAKRIMASKHTWTGFWNILRRSAAWKLLVLWRCPSPRSASSLLVAEMHLPYKLT